MNNIRIGTLVNGIDSVRIIPQIIDYGFESFSLTFYEISDELNLKELAHELNEILTPKNAIISSVSIYNNPLSEDKDKRNATIRGFEKLINNAHYFGTDIVAGFAGRIENKSIDESIPLFKDVFSELGFLAKDKGIRLAFENCEMKGNWNTGDWNIAHTPLAWEMMFDAVPLDNLGLQWEPCHQMVKLIDPIVQLKKWVGKIFHIHGKDATIDWDIIREYGINGPKKFAYDRTPGFGDCNWTKIISILRQNGYVGTIDIEGWHDPVYNGELEMMGQVHALHYLKNCRGGDYIPNPV